MPAFLTVDDFPFGELYANDPDRRRKLTGDRNRLVAGAAVAADSLRLWLDVPAGGSDLEVRVGEVLLRTFQAGTRGYRCLDLSDWRGAKLQPSLPDGGLVGHCGPGAAGRLLRATPSLATLSLATPSLVTPSLATLSMATVQFDDRRRVS